MASFYIDGANAPIEIKTQLNLLSKDILFEREVTKGGNGYLFFGVSRILDKRLAVKFYYWGGKTDYHAEPQVLANIASPNVLEVQSAGLLDGDWAYFVTPHCENGDMDDVIEKTEIGNIKALDLVSGLLMGVGALHEQRYLHRDLKPANVYVGAEYDAIIGDFGSIKYLPETATTIPASSHSVLYRPTESIDINSYGFSGDIYQVGVVLYQLLGGHLPYDEVSWLSASEKKHYNELSGDADKSIFADQCIKQKILKGKLLDFKTLPAWVPGNLKSVVRKATNVNPDKRFRTASSFQVTLNNLRSEIPNWIVESGMPTLIGETSFRIMYENEKLVVKKKREVGSGAVIIQLMRVASNRLCDRLCANKIEVEKRSVTMTSSFNSFFAVAKPLSNIVVQTNGGA